MPHPSPYWFPAKRFGWGWGPPTSWQGRVVMLLFGAGEVALAVRFLPQRAATFAIATLVLTALLVAVCLVKGEPPAWRWGDRDR